MTRVEVLVGDDRRVTEVAPGESWLAAARRTTPGPHDPVAVDLSGEVKRFAVDPDLVVAVRPMTYGDLPDVVAWRAAPHVLRWWDADLPDLEAATAKYGSRIDGASRTSMWVWEVNGRSVGFAQDYRIRDYPDHALLVPDPDATGVDYLIGRAEWVGRGVGTRCLWAWVLHLRARRVDATAAFAAPDHRNRASLRALAKVGFVEGLWFDEPQADGSVDTVVGCTLDLATVIGDVAPCHNSVAGSF
ncbi:GNAT family N-acetyltransferase [Nocardioides plantarum]|uniref:GNAT family N-acetyltransferase n=1 Tax=Nocardioides plantarum TaxID=29299 RepID=A0ABV5KGV5_9ACTN|nr:GNAT family N-acetyltransferase [Nocardioides plantarum]